MSYVSTLRIRLQKASRPAGRAGDASNRSMSAAQAEGGAGEPRAECPVFTKPLTDVTADESSTIVLQGTVVGTSPITISWLLNGKAAKFGRASVSDGVAQWVIEDCLPEDAGTYVCVAESPWGRVSSSATVTIQDFETLQRSKQLPKELKSTNCEGGFGKTHSGHGASGYSLQCQGEKAPFSPGLLCSEDRNQKMKSKSFPNENEEEEEEEVVEFCVTINTSQKLTDLYIQQECLGVGAFGKVYKLLGKSSGKIRAGKFYKARTLKDKKSARDEIEIMNCLHHPKLVQCLDAFESISEIVMVMEYVSGGELFERIVNEDFELTEPTCISYICQILQGVSFMHQQSIVHLDLKPENIVCVNKDSTRIKIIDFGLARKLDLNGSLKVMFGTPEFVAPEVINYDSVGFPTDVWSIGVICYILLSGLSPFQGDSDADTLTNVTAVCWEFDEDAFAEISGKAKHFISHLLLKDMRKRLACEDCLHHPWLQSREKSSAKMLSKDRMKQFLARQKWRKAGKALLALKRLALPLSKQDESESVLEPQDKSVLSLTQHQEELSLKDEQIQRTPLFSKSLQDVEELESSACCLHCHVEGYPDPEVVWYKNGDALTESSHYQIDYQEDGSCSLIITNVTQEDSGYYTCKALNALGEKTCSATLVVYPLELPHRS
ncbi:myosin light chain kinase, smooth muscle-like [Amblyraja radiata]|uniref:myosin light chain kinase, smooth muscle-like n=1 Tax=Amblyraja radiata TaxID=386614 RepID=UPI0014037DF4|nr:myosin light chain kinase, smooth muscle-like [Amblyraja radiata]